MGEFDDLMKDFGAFADETPVLDEFMYYAKVKTTFLQYFKLTDAIPLAPYVWARSNADSKTISLFCIGNSFEHKFTETYQMRGIQGMIKINSANLKQEAHLIARAVSEQDTYSIPFHVIELSYTELSQQKSPNLSSLGKQIETNFINLHPSLELNTRNELIKTRLNSFSEKASESHMELESLWKNYIKKSKLLGSPIQFEFDAKAERK